MKIGILSDTHRMETYIDKAIPYLYSCDLIIHAGDNFADSKYIHKITNKDIIAVKGNCDFIDVEEEIVFEIQGKTIFLCHGDMYSVKYGLDKIEEKAKDLEADIVIFGHTHVPLRIEKDNILYLNPGSISLPREGSNRQFILMDIEDDKISLEEVII